MDVDGTVVAVELPEGLYHSRDALFSALQEGAREQYPNDLAYFGVKYTPGVPFVSIGDVSIVKRYARIVTWTS